MNVSDNIILSIEYTHVHYSNLYNGQECGTVWFEITVNRCCHGGACVECYY